MTFAGYDVAVARMTLRQRLAYYAFLAAFSAGATHVFRLLFAATAVQPLAVTVFVTSSAGIILGMVLLILLSRFGGSPPLPPPFGGDTGCGGDVLLLAGIIFLAIAPAVMMIWILQPPPVQKRALRIGAVLASFGFSFVYMSRHPHEYTTLIRKIECLSAVSGFAVLLVEVFSE